MQGVIFGQNISGRNIGDSMLKFNNTGTNEIFTGGQFGPEGTSFVAIILFLACIYYYYKFKKKPEGLVE